MRGLGILVLLSLLAVLGYWLTHPEDRVPEKLPPPTQIATPNPTFVQPARLKPNFMPMPNEAKQNTLTESRPQAQILAPSAQGKTSRPALHYQLQDGLIVVQGDVVIGAPTQANLPATGLVQLPILNLWPGGVMPFHIQPDVVEPQRILQAIGYFAGTAVRLVPYTNEDDAVVFVQSESDCKSYVGKMGGKQPIYLSANCGVKEIAHEILHAFGFVHEQNRADRDAYINMHFENIDERFVDNFEKLPTEYMKVSGLADFDFSSIMIYPPWMFAKNGQSTMDPKSNDQLIQPSAQLSVLDIERLNRAYGTKTINSN